MRIDEDDHGQRTQLQSWRWNMMEPAAEFVPNDVVLGCGLRPVASSQPGWARKHGSISEMFQPCLRTVVATQDGN